MTYIDATPNFCIAGDLKALAARLHDQLDQRERELLQEAATRIEDIGDHEDPGSWAGGGAGLAGDDPKVGGGGGLT
jgi:hypothetical protein